MRSEWELNAPEDELDEKLAYPGDWRDAQNAILASRRGSDGEGWGSYELTVHRVQHRLSLCRIMAESIRHSFGFLLKPFTLAKA